MSNLIVDTDDGTGSGNTITENSTNAVRVHGVSLVASASLTSAVAATLGYTYTTSEQGNTLAGGYSSLPGLPSNRVNASVDAHPARVPFGGTLTVFWVGDIFDNVSGFGGVPSGNYAVVDLAGRYFLDPRRRHRVNLRLENLFDDAYQPVVQVGAADESTMSVVAEIRPHQMARGRCKAPIMTTRRRSAPTSIKSVAMTTDGRPCSPRGVPSPIN